MSCNATPFFACSMLIFSGLVSLEKTIDRPWRDAQGLASIEPPEVIAKILAHLERTAPPQPKQPEVPPGARAPPVQSTLR